MKLGEAMYKAQQAEAAAAQSLAREAKKKDDDVIDAEFKEVGGDDKKEGLILPLSFRTDQAGLRVRPFRCRPAKP